MSFTNHSNWVWLDQGGDSWKWYDRNGGQDFGTHFATADIKTPNQGLRPQTRGCRRRGSRPLAPVCDDLLYASPHTRLQSRNSRRST